MTSSVIFKNFYQVEIFRNLIEHLANSQVWFSVSVQQTEVLTLD